MSAIRGDLVGVVWYVVEGGQPRSLKAGDEVPEGVEVGDHLLAPEEAPEEAAVEAPAGNASTEVWQEFAKSQGASDDDVAGKSRDELRETYGS